MQGIRAFLKNKKRLLLLIVFVCVVAVAVIAITYGVVSYGHKDEGYYAVEVKPESQVTVFDSGLHFMYYADGGSDAIKQTLNAVSAAFSQSLERAYKLLDADTEYEGYTNIATLNNNPGQTFEVSAELYAVLTDALAKTREQSGYSVFGGALYSEWRAILFLEEPYEFDPLVDASVAARLESIAAATDAHAAALILSDADTRAARFDLSPEYIEFLSAAEVSAPVLDLNLLKDAYLTQLVASDMTSRGYDEGYLYTDSGVCVMLNRDDMRFELFGCANRAVSAAGGVMAKPNSVYCQLTAFPLTGLNYGYYAFESEGGLVYRHPWIDTQTGKPQTLLLSVAAVAEGASAVEVAYKLLPLFAMTSEASVQAALRALPFERVTSAYTLSALPNELRARQNAQNAIVIDADAPYTLKDF